MLVLSRKEGQSFEITVPHTGESIVIHLYGFRRAQARIAIDAPSNFNIRRSELPGLPLARSSEAPATTGVTQSRSSLPATLPKGQLPKPTAWEESSGVYEGADDCDGIAARAEFEAERSGK